MPKVEWKRVPGDTLLRAELERPGERLVAFGEYRDDELEPGFVTMCILPQVYHEAIVAAIKATAVRLDRPDFVPLWEQLVFGQLTRAVLGYAELHLSGAPENCRGHVRLAGDAVGRPSRHVLEVLGPLEGPAQSSRSPYQVLAELRGPTEISPAQVSELVRRFKHEWQDLVAFMVKDEGHPKGHRKDLRLTQRTIARLLDELVDRARRMNDDPSGHTHIRRITLFGSATDPHARPGDIDILLELVPREKADPEANKLYMRSHVIEHPTIQEDIFTTLTLRQLRGSSTAFSFVWGKDWNERVKRIPHKVLFEDERDVQLPSDFWSRVDAMKRG